MTFWTILIILLLLLITAVVLSWVALSHDPFTNTELHPNGLYEVNGRKYCFPDITVQGKCLLLKEHVIENLRTLMKRVDALFQDLNIDYHVSGGTLLGVERHGTIPMPYDDDIDLAVNLEHREFLFSKEFQEHASKFGLDTRFLAGTTLKRADRHGAALRLQLNDSNSMETCDVFFLSVSKEGVFKIDGWNDMVLQKNVKEQFRYEDVFPRQHKQIDGLDVSLPNNPKALLLQQYGPEVFHTAKIRPRLISHAFPMQFLRLLWVKSI